MDVELLTKLRLLRRRVANHAGLRSSVFIPATPPPASASAPWRARTSPTSCLPENHACPA
jgi:hypothetical protein